MSPNARSTAKHLAGVRPKRRLFPRMSATAREAISGYLFISPWIIGLVLFTAGPIIAALALSFTKYSVFSPPKWVGLENFGEIATDDRLVGIALYNTAYFVVVSVPIRLTLAFGIALLLNAQIRGKAVYRTLFYLPTVVPPVAASVLWMWILQPYTGILNYVLSNLGLPPPQWLFSEVWSKPAIILLRLWHIGGPVVIFLAGLQGLPRHIFEAAEIDGAGVWRRLVRITIPLMTPTILYNLIIDLIQSFQAFTASYMMTRGGPLNSTLFYVLYVYRHAFEHFNLGYASALSVILFVIVLVVTVLMMRLSNYWVYYETE